MIKKEFTENPKAVSAFFGLAAIGIKDS